MQKAKNILYEITMTLIFFKGSYCIHKAITTLNFDPHQNLIIWEEVLS